MTFSDQLSPALMLFHEKGDLLFANTEATELTGLNPEEMKRLDDCLMRLFSRSTHSELISGILWRATSKVMIPDQVRFTTEFTARSGQQQQASFHFQFWNEGRSGGRILLCMLPVSQLLENGSAGAPPAGGPTEQVQELLDEAMSAVLAIRREGCSREDLDRLVRKIAKSRCILTGTQGLERVWARTGQARPGPTNERAVIPGRRKKPDTKIAT